MISPPALTSRRPPPSCTVTLALALPHTGCRLSSVGPVPRPATTALLRVWECVRCPHCGVCWLAPLRTVVCVYLQDWHRLPPLSSATGSPVCRLHSRGCTPPGHGASLCWAVVLAAGAELQHARVGMVRLWMRHCARVVARPYCPNRVTLVWSVDVVWREAGALAVCPTVCVLSSTPPPACVYVMRAGPVRTALLWTISMGLCNRGRRHAMVWWMQLGYVAAA